MNALPSQCVPSLPGVQHPASASLPTRACCSALQEAARDVEAWRAPREVGGQDHVVLGDDTLPMPQRSMLQEDMALTYHPIVQEYAQRSIPQGLGAKPDGTLFTCVPAHSRCCVQLSVHT